MQKSTYQRQNATGTAKCTDNSTISDADEVRNIEIRTDGGVADSPEVTDEEESLPSLEDLTAFQRHTLAVLAGGPNYGLGIKRDLESWSGEEINHGRLYPNLDQLIEAGLVEKRELDKRTNEYELTETGLATHQQYLDDLHAASDGVVPERGGDD